MRRIAIVGDVGRLFLRELTDRDSRQRSARR
jgi:hypothetical protein